MLSEPETYGLSRAQTLAHRVTTRQPEDFSAFWAEFREEIVTLPVTPRTQLHYAWQSSGDRTESRDDVRERIRMQSLRDIEIIGELQLPTGHNKPRALVLELHGSMTEDDFTSDPAPWQADDIATLRLRVRGYPPSVDGLGDRRMDWILHNLGVQDAWIVRGAVGDVVLAYRVFREMFGESTPITMHGSSLGGGLAVIAAAQLNALGMPPARLSLDLPSLGDWNWRTGHYCSGYGGLVNTALENLRGQDRDDAEASLAYFDAALHASAVACPVLCRLAVQDDVVPAPTAAAVVNELASQQVLRFITDFGHFDGGIANARQIAAYQRLAARFVDPAVEWQKFEQLIAEVQQS